MQIMSFPVNLMSCKHRWTLHESAELKISREFLSTADRKFICFYFWIQDRGENVKMIWARITSHVTSLLNKKNRLDHGWRDCFLREGKRDCLFSFKLWIQIIWMVIIGTNVRRRGGSVCERNESILTSNSTSFSRCLSVSILQMSRFCLFRRKIFMKFHACIV